MKAASVYLLYKAKAYPTEETAALMCESETENNRLIVGCDANAKLIIL